MKKNSILNSFFILILAGCSATQPPENNYSNEEVFSPDFLENRVTDLRALVSPQNDIDFLVKNQKCSVRSGRHGSRKRAISVGFGLKLSEVVKLYLGEPYDGQVKVVSQNNIFQTSIETYDPSEQDKINVNPGDIVFIDARD